MLKLKNKKYWFTLVEIIILCSLFSFLILWVIVAINRSFTFVNNTRLAVRAANFAREWMEMMYNIRDTNRRKNAWQRDANWLNLSMDSTSTDHFEKWFYTIKQDNDWVLKAEKIKIRMGSCSCTEDEFGQSYENETNFFDNSNNCSMNIRDWRCGPVKLSNGDVMTEELLDGVEFYRLVHVFGIYQKDTNDPNAEITEVNLTDWTPAEMRFCVKVFYRDGNWKHSSELCGLMTNFTE